MLGHWLSACAALIVMLGAWVAIQAMARRVAARHPEAGPYREAGGGCGGGCGGCGKSCAEAAIMAEHKEPLSKALGSMSKVI